jgi:S1-C subfamily serine protease
MKKIIIPFIIGLLVALPLGTFAATKIISARFTDNTVEINGNPISGEVAAIQKEGEKYPSTFLNLQAIAQGLGGKAYVESDGKTIQIEILTDLETVVKNCKDSCVMIYAYGDPSLPAGAYAQGSGWIYNGYVVTAKHVIENATKIDVFTDDSLYGIPATVYPIKTDLDIAILKCNTGLPSAELGDSDKLIEGEKLVSITSPNGNMNSIDECLNSGITRYSTETILTISESSINIGSSGGAVFNYEGEVIGLVTNGLEETHSAIPINDIKPILKQIK